MHTLWKKEVKQHSKNTQLVRMEPEFRFGLCPSRYVTPPPPLFFRAAPAAFGSSQARGQIGTAAAGLRPQPHQYGIWAMSLTYIEAHSNARLLTRWEGSRIEPVSSRILVRFITTQPQWEPPPRCAIRTLITLEQMGEFLRMPHP